MTRPGRPSPRRQALAMAVLAGLYSHSTLAAATPGMEEMWRIIQAQQKEIEQLKRTNQQLNERVEATAATVERSGAAPSPAATASGHGTSGSRTSLGGYGELHYNNLDSKKEIDFHRFVMFFGHEFNDRIRFFSELEVEHAVAGEGKEGEVELEQAYVEIDHGQTLRSKAGLFLLPVGILNETHEPNSFYGVERNPVESNIIPTTWWEGGIGLTGRAEQSGISWDVALTSGLEVPTSTYRIRSGRQKVSEATAENLALTGRVKWTGRPGIELSATAHYQDDITQGQGPAGSSSSATLIETHAAIKRGPFGLRALYARWDLDGSGPAAVGADEQYGWYLEPSWRINDRLGLFARYAQWDNNAGSGSTADTKRRQTNVGVNYWPHANVVFKFDLQSSSGASGDDGFNLGVGYMF